MIEIPKDLAERIYSQYEITTIDPLPFDEFFTIKEVIPGAGPVIKVKDVRRHAYERAIVKPEGQLFWVNELQAKEANPKEPYDVGFFNALSFCMLVFSGKEPVYIKKPGSQVDKDKAARKRIGAIKKTHAEDLESTVEEIKTNAEEIKSNAEEIKALKDEIKKVKKAG